MAIVSSLILGYLKLHFYVLGDYVVLFLLPLSRPPSNDFIHTSLMGFSIFLIYFNITIPTGLIAARFYIVCTKSGFKKNSVIKVLGFCIILTLLQAISITFPFNKHVSSDIISNAIKKYDIESYMLTESTVALGLEVTDSKFISLVIFVPIYFTVNYLLIIYFVRKYKVYIKRHKDLISRQTQKINKEFMTILVVQTFTPVCLTGGPILVIIILFMIQKIYNISFFLNNIIHLISFIPSVNGFLFAILLPSNRKLILSTLNKIADTFMCRKSNQINNIRPSNVFSKKSTKISDSKTNSKQKRTHQQNSVKV
uniref:G_PROTEIN_RECEP_F1_2 domain-containing protein n=1 Tax=Strongyloides papillosus TaxID=174720 RepID=A0A0N5C4Y3_STREA